MKLVPSENLQVVRSNEDIYIYNSLFGNLLKTTQESLDFIDFFKDGNDTENVEKQFGKEAIKKIEEFQQRLFLIEDGLDEREILRAKIAQIESKIKTGGLLYKLQLVTTTGCNLACKMCYRRIVVDPLLRERQIKMNFQTAKKAVDGFLSVTQRNNKEEIYIRFFGGEPLLNWDLVKDVVAYIDSLGIRKPKVKYLLNTNGIGINVPISKFLSNYDFHVELSLDGAGEINDKIRRYPSGRGTFKEIDRAIDILKDHGVDTEISSVLVDDNLYHLRELIDYVHNKGLDEIDINTVHYASQLGLKASTEERVEQLVDARKYGKEKGVTVGGKWFKLYKKTDEPFFSYCKRMGEQLSVEPSGDIYPCSAWPIKIGNVENIDAIFNSKNYRKVVMRRTGNLPLCYGCEIEGICVGGCAGGAYILTRDTYNPELDECEFRKKITKKLIPMESLEATKSECNQI